MPPCFRFLLYALGACAALPAATPRLPLRYALIDLGAAGYSSTATALNDRGEIVGTMQLDPGGGRAFLWSHGQLQDLGVLPGTRDSVALGINDAGEVVGHCSENYPTTGQRPFLFSGGTLRTVPGLDNSYTAVAIDRAGRIAGNYFKDFREVAYVLEAGRTRNFGTLPGAVGVTIFSWSPRWIITRPTALNAAGVIVGKGHTSTGRMQAFRSANGALIELFPGTTAAESSACAINSRGEIVGWIRPDSGGAMTTAFLQRDGITTPLPALRDDDPAATALGINDAGVIVGSASRSAVAWEDGRVVELAARVDPANPVRPNIRTATAINNRFEIIGEAWLAGYYRACLLTPVPEIEPASRTVSQGEAAVFSASLIGLAPERVQWRRNGVDLPGETRATLVLSSVTANDAGAYTVTVEGPDGQPIESPRATLALRTPGPGYSFRTLAGQASSSTRLRDGPGNEARFYSPRGLAVDPSGNVFVADSGNRAVRMISPSGIVTTVAGDPWGSDGVHFSQLNGIARSNTGTLCVADTFDHFISRMTPSGFFLRFAGNRGSPGGEDGWTTARFAAPSGLAFDAAGNLFVADLGNNAIRRVSPDGVVTTVAGAANVLWGATDGPGNIARFDGPTSLAFDAAGFLYIADSRNRTIRKMSPQGVVSTLAGRSHETGHRDGPGDQARFENPVALTVDAHGNVVVCDGRALRHVDPSGFVTTLAGDPAEAGAADGASDRVRFVFPAGIALDDLGRLYVSDVVSNTIRVGEPSAPPILPGPSFHAVEPGTALALSLPPLPAGLSIQWQRDGTPIPGATRTTLSFAATSAHDMGLYTVILANAAGRAESAVAVLAVASAAPGRLGNLAAEGALSPDGALTIGFTLNGDSSRTLLLRSAGPALAALGVARALDNPQLQLIRTSDRAPLLGNDDWSTTPALIEAFRAAGAFPFTVGSRDAALTATLSPGGFLLEARAAPGARGDLALAEIYDLADPRQPGGLANCSVLAALPAAHPMVTAGFVVPPSAPVRVLIRAVGPGLSALGVTDAVPAPRLELFRGSTQIAGNLGWNSLPTLAAVFRQVGAFDLPAGSADAALVLTLPPGAYTAQVSDATGRVGLVLLELYTVP